MSIVFSNLVAELDEQKIHIENWQLKQNQVWAIAGSNGGGKTMLGQIFSDQTDKKILQGEVSGIPARTIIVSLEEQRKLIDQERYLDQSDITNEVDPGTLVKDFLAPLTETKQFWIDGLNTGHLAEQGLRSLSTGETRKVLLIKALAEINMTGSHLLVLDEPLEGIDKASKEFLMQQLQIKIQQGLHLLWIANRLDEVPEWITHIAFMHQMQILIQGTREDVFASPELNHLLHFDADIEVPDTLQESELSTAEPLVKLTNAKVAYGDKVIFDQLDWCINPGQHWAIQGPNGCGKTTLLQLISGDHPQCYSNDIFQFGMQRGSGESIWEIKKHIGLISASSQWEYRVSTNLVSTVISGLFDTIGLYNQIADYERELAMKWLRLINLADRANDPLQSLSYGEQRMVLIARAMIKRPPLLILDEPCQGLDDVNRALVQALVATLAKQQQTSLLYVTHHEEDILPEFEHRLIFQTGKSGSKAIVA